MTGLKPQDFFTTRKGEELLSRAEAAKLIVLLQNLSGDKAVINIENSENIVGGKFNYRLTVTQANNPKSEGQAVWRISQTEELAQEQAASRPGAGGSRMQYSAPTIKNFILECEGGVWVIKKVRVKKDGTNEVEEASTHELNRLISRLQTAQNSEAHSQAEQS